MFGSGDNSEAFDEYSAALRKQGAKYNPWIDTGQKGMETAYAEFEKGIKNPNFLQDQISKDYYSSPYQKYMEDQVTKRMNMNAANTGMLGSGGANRALQSELTNMTGQFMNEYINRGISTYGMGLQGAYNTGVQGLNALGSQSSLESEAAAADYQAAASEAGASASGLGTVLGIAGGVVGAIYGGPAGAMAGYSLGSAAGGMIGGGGGGEGGPSMKGIGNLGGKGNSGGQGNKGSTFDVSDWLSWMSKEGDRRNAAAGVGTTMPTGTGGDMGMMGGGGRMG